jgi:hypothetical protein
VSDPREPSGSPSPASSPSPGSPSGAEPRVGELLARGAAAAESEDLDPATIAQLAAWFGAPAAGPVPAAPEAPRDADAATRRALALEAVDPGFVSALQARWDRGEALLRVTARMARPRRAPSKFDLAVWNLHLGDELREVERPEDIGDTLKDPTPQAVLRDLHRPEQQWPRRFLPQDLGLDIAGLRTRARIDDILATNYAVRIDDEPIPARIMAEQRAALRAHLNQPWEDSYIPPENRRGPASSAPTPEDLKWFGSMGFDPDL